MAIKAQVRVFSQSSRCAALKIHAADFGFEQDARPELRAPRPPLNRDFCYNTRIPRGGMRGAGS